MDLKLIYSNGTEIKSLAKDAKYCKQNKLHKYLLPEIMVESKYVKAMKMREKARALAISFRMWWQRQNSSNCNAACLFIVHFMYILAIL